MVISTGRYVINKDEHSVLYKSSQTYKYTHKPEEKKKKSSKTPHRHTQVLNFHCDLQLEHSNLILSQITPAYENVLSN